MAQDTHIGLDNLSAPEGSRKERIRRGRGTGSGLGKTAGRGGKGQTARSGKGRPRGFEGGQMPLYRRIPKFGFKNPNRKEFDVVNLDLIEANFETGSVIDIAALSGKGLVRRNATALKILGDGSLTKKFTIKAHKFSKTATLKITQAGGQTEELGVPEDQTTKGE